MSCPTAVLSIRSKAILGEPRLLFPERGSKGRREKRAGEERRGQRWESGAVGAVGTTPSQHAARWEGAVDIYRKKDRAAVTPSHPDGGSRERAGRGVPLARAASPRPHRSQSCSRAQGDPEPATTLTCRRYLRLDATHWSASPKAERHCSPAPDGTGSPVCKARPTGRCAEQ